MRTGSISPHDCVRACQQVSLRVDSELSEFEEVLLEAHLARCPDCRAYAERVTEVTEILRTGPLEPPARSFQLPRRRAVPALSRPRFRFAPGRQARVFVRGAISAAAVAVVAIGGLVGGHMFAAPPSSGTDVRAAHELLGIKERAFQQLEVVASPVPVRRGLMAAEQAALGAETTTTRQPDRDATRLGFRPDG